MEGDLPANQSPCAIYEYVPARYFWLRELMDGYPSPLVWTEITDVAHWSLIKQRVPGRYLFYDEKYVLKSGWK